MGGSGNDGGWRRRRGHERQADGGSQSHRVEERFTARRKTGWRRRTSHEVIN
jgi:hypothetical protein